MTPVFGAQVYTVTNAGSLTVSPGYPPGTSGLVAGTVKRIRVRNLGPGMVFVTANDLGAADNHTDSTPRSDRGYPVGVGESLQINTESLNLDIDGDRATRVAVIAEV